MLTPQPKRKSYRNKKILAAARGEACLVNLPSCTGGGEDTVAAHSMQADDGKGTSIKADDCFVAFACQHCHDILDARKHLVKWDGTEDSGRYGQNMPKAEIEWYHDRGIKRTIRRLLELEIIE